MIFFLIGHFEFNYNVCEMKVQRMGHNVFVGQISTSVILYSRVPM